MTFGDALSTPFLSASNAIDLKSAGTASTVFKHNGSVYFATSAHHSTQQAVHQPNQQFGYMNAAIEMDIDFGTIENMLRKSGLTNVSSPEYIQEIEVPPRGIGLGSDIWGATRFSMNTVGTREYTYYSLQTTSKGMVIIKMTNDGGAAKANMKVTPLQYISGYVVNAWGDVKTYDVAEITLSGDLSDIRGCLLRDTVAQARLKSVPARQLCTSTCRYDGNNRCFDGGPGALSTIAYCTYGTECEDCGPRDPPNPTITYSDALFGMHVLEITNVGPQTVKLRVKMEFDLVVESTIDMFQAKGHNAKTVNLTVDTVERSSMAYFVKESGGRLLSIDLNPLIVEGTEAIVTTDAYNTTGDWVLKNESTGVEIVGSLKGSHNVYVNEEQGMLYVVGGLSSAVVDGTSVGTGILYDIKATPKTPVAKGLVYGEEFHTYIHDIVTVSYGSAEQHEILGIPMNHTTELAFYALCPVVKSTLSTT
jgi:hypothetical protein